MYKMFNKIDNNIVSKPGALFLKFSTDFHYALCSLWQQTLEAHSGLLL